MIDESWMSLSRSLSNDLIDIDRFLKSKFLPYFRSWTKCIILASVAFEIPVDDVKVPAAVPTSAETKEEKEDPEALLQKIKGKLRNKNFSF
jgi:hypothetical protein